MMNVHVGKLRGTMICSPPSTRPITRNPRAPSLRGIELAAMYQARSTCSSQRQGNASLTIGPQLPVMSTMQQSKTTSATQGAEMEMAGGLQAVTSASRSVSRTNVLSRTKTSRIQAPQAARWSFLLNTYDSGYNYTPTFS